MCAKRRQGALGRFSLALVGTLTGSSVTAYAIVIALELMHRIRGLSGAPMSNASRHVVPALIALLAACGSRTPLSGEGFSAIPDASTVSGGAGGGRGGTGGISGAAAGGQSGANGVGGAGGSTVGGGGSTVGSGGSTGGSGGDAGMGPGGQGGGGAGGTSPCSSQGTDAGCTIACGSVPCPVRCGEPRVLVRTPVDEQIMAIAVSADTLFYGTQPTQKQGGVYAMPLSGGTPKLLADNVLVRALVLEGNMLYYVHASRSGGMALHAIPSTGGNPIELFQALEIQDVTPDPSGVYFTARWSGPMPEILHTGRDGTGTERVAGPDQGIAGFTLDNENIYWTIYRNGGVLFQKSLWTGTGTTLAQSMDPISSPIVDGVDIAFVQGTSTPDTCRSAVMSVVKSSGGNAPPRRISPGTSGVDVMALARDDTHLYWSSTGSHGAVLRMQKGQIPEIIAADQRSASRPVLGTKDVYWIAYAGSAYEVRTVSK